MLTISQADQILEECKPGFEAVDYEFDPTEEAHKYFDDFGAVVVISGNLNEFAVSEYQF